MWWIQARTTHTAPTALSSQAGSLPAAAARVSAGNRTKLGGVPEAPRANVGSFYDSTIPLLQGMRAHLIRLESYLEDDRAIINALVDRVANLESAANTNAARIDQVRNYSRDGQTLVGPVVDVLKRDGIAR